ncbi:MAG: aldo/keto reductase, partial [Actinomycetia bacterium]|nr:aldo/keto reductase [Actinomycetes bacterium]
MRMSSDSTLSTAACVDTGDVNALVTLLTDDVRVSMPPIPLEYHGRDAVARLHASIIGQDRTYDLVPTRANGQLAFGAYLRNPPGTPGTTGVHHSDYGRGMDYRSLGRTGMQVSPLCLGAMMFGAWGEPDHDTSIKIIHRALDAGINFIDTADVYSQGESEIIVGKALANGRRDDVILATKFHGPMDVAMGQPGGDPNKRGNSRRWIIQE